MTTIKELEPGQSDITIEGTIIEKAPIRTFRKFGKPGKVASSIFEDESGQIALTLWNEDAENLEEGDKIKIIGGEVKEWRDAPQLNPGRDGKIEKLEAAEE
jgi:ssDNA-binding replication factor A large subunit